MNEIIGIILLATPLFFSVILHEISHGWVAEKLGDPTARMMGRITLNPISHIDLIGTILIPGLLLYFHSPFLFGWAKPVPINFANLRGGRRDMALVALSGPLCNLLLAVISSVIFHLTSGGIRNPGTTWGGIFLLIHIMAGLSVQINIVLMAVNLLPIVPLDGGRIVVGLAPTPIAVAMARLERYGMLIVMLLIASGLWSYVVNPVISIFRRILM